MDRTEQAECLIKKFPQVGFQLNEDLDVCKINIFISQTSFRGGRNFQQVIQREHLQLQGVELLSEDERKIKIADYVHDYYQQRKDQLVGIPQFASEKWVSYAPLFFELTGRIFKNLTWPPGRYEGYPTISSPCPRFLDSKTFQIPFDLPQSWIGVTAHEMLHFIFFEYVRRRYVPQLPNTIERNMTKLLEGKFSVHLWNLSEVFNTLILADKTFGKGSTKSMKLYPALVDDLKIVQQVWQETNGDIDDFFSRMETPVNTSKL